jgi:hypothetical protein
VDKTSCRVVKKGMENEVHIELEIIAEHKFKVLLFRIVVGCGK